MELRHARYFVMVAEEKNVSRAAGRLHVTQPAVSRQIKDLETELGVSLFTRRSHGLALTEAGRVALKHAREMLKQAAAINEATQPFRDKRESVKLRVGYISPFLPAFLGEHVRDFARREPDIRIDLFDMNPHRQIQALKGNEIELALLGQPVAEVRSLFSWRLIGRVEMAAVLPDSHPLVKRRSIDLAELKNETFIGMREPEFGQLRKPMEKMFQRAGFVPRFVDPANGTAELLGQISAGIGVSVIPKDIEFHRQSGVTFVKLRRPKLAVISVVAWKKKHETPELLKFVDTLAPGGK